MASPVKLTTMKIDPRSPEHPYKQLAAQLRHQVAPTGSGRCCWPQTYPHEQMHLLLHVTLV
jgi:hypothetical protein